MAKKKKHITPRISYHCEKCNIGFTQALDRWPENGEKIISKCPFCKTECESIFERKVTQ